jgi:hypothetical protein
MPERFKTDETLNVMRASMDTFDGSVIPRRLHDGLEAFTAGATAGATPVAYRGVGRWTAKPYPFSTVRLTVGFFKNQQINAALRLLAWQYERNGQPLPERVLLEGHARQLVDDAHRIARERGGNVLAILKQMVDQAIRK